MRLRQSDLKLWNRCPLAWKYQNLDHLPRLQSGSLTFGSILHDCVLFLETQQDLAGAIARFQDLWSEPTLLGPEFAVNYYVRGTNWKKFSEEGPKILRDWWGIHQWDSDVVLAREYTFDVPIGDGHVLHGTVDKLVLRFEPKLNRRALRVVDFKTDNKTPTYDYLAEDLQFTAYGFATTQEEFWTGIPNGIELFKEFQDFPRYGEWVQLKGPKRMDAGERVQRHYSRLIYAVNAISDSVAMRIFVPTISGESCRYCDFREVCGLPVIED